MRGVPWWVSPEGGAFGGRVGAGRRKKWLGKSAPNVGFCMGHAKIDRPPPPALAVGGRQ